MNARILLPAVLLASGLGLSAPALADEYDTLAEITEALLVEAERHDDCAAQAEAVGRAIDEAAARLDRLGANWRELATAPSEAQREQAAALAARTEALCAQTRTELAYARSIYKDGATAAAAAWTGKRWLETASAAPPSVTVVFVFPVARDYLEEFFGLRAAVAGTMRQLDGQRVAIGAVVYDQTPTVYDPVRGPERTTLRETLVGLENTADERPPDLVAGIEAGLGVLETLPAGQARVLVVISDGQGLDASTRTRQLDTLRQRVGELGVRPLIVGYTPDGPDELVHRDWLEALAGSSGSYLEATEMDELPAAMDRIVEALD